MAILPFLGLGDADNGKLGHDFAVRWLPNFALAIVGAGVSVAMLMLEKRRPELGNRVLLPPAVIAAAAAVIFLAHV